MTSPTIAHAAVDRGDHAQRQVELVQHRALLDVHLDETEVARRVALQRGDVVHVPQPGGLHRGAHRHAVGVLLLQPGGVEVADQRARAQEGGLVALAFFFGEADDLDAEGQPPAGARAARARRPSAPGCPAGRRTCRRCARCRSGCRSAAAAPARRCRGRRRRRCPPRRCCTSSKPQSPASRPCSCARAGAVRVGEVGHRQLALFRETGVAVHGQLPRPSPRPGCPARARRRTCRSGGSRRCGGCCAGTRRARSRGWPCSRRAKVAMISARDRPSPRGPRTARMKGQPKRAL